MKNIPRLPTGRRIPTFAFVGSSGSGKTTLIEGVLPFLQAHGYRVGVVKHAHRGFEIDRPGKDSHRVRRAGAVQVLLGSNRQWALIGEQPPGADDPRLDALIARFDPREIDLVLAEGFSHEAVPKIEVFRPAHGRPPRCWPLDPDVVAVASDADLVVEPPVTRLELNRPESVAEFIAGRASPERRAVGGPRFGR
jgi:molybdopterin-guanine dinucleotide biosynthesis protein MobB